MKINIVTTEDNWVLYRIAQQYAKHIDGAVLNTVADKSADINFYINYGNFKEKTKLDVGFFTHRERAGDFSWVFNRAIRKFDSVARKVDYCIAMCDKTAEFLPKEKTSVVHVAPDDQFYKGNIVFGVVGREYRSGRKRTSWIRELEKIEGIEIKFTDGKYKWEEMPEFYKSIDYLLILSDNEGGPAPLLEALSMGVPVISSDVGFVDSFTTIRYSTLEGLKDIIKGLVIPKGAWEKSAREVEEVFLRLKNVGK